MDTSRCNLHTSWQDLIPLLLVLRTPDHIMRSRDHLTTNYTGDVTVTRWRGGVYEVLWRVLGVSVVLLLHGMWDLSPTEGILGIR